MKKFNFKEKLSKGRAVYITAAVSLGLTVAAIGIIYSNTMNTLERSLPEISTTRQVNINQTDEIDPRTEKTTKAKTVTKPTERTTTVPEKKITTRIKNTTSAEAQTKTEVSTAVSVMASQSFIRPHDGEIIRPYSPDVPIYSETMNDWRTHNGIDIAVKEGDEVVSIGKGKVTKVTVDSSFGYTIEVDYGTLTAKYCGMKQGECAGIGQLLEKGDSIGVVDTVACESAAGPHLHFEVIVDGEQKNPVEICKW